jgi:phosphoenolpyruvate synthase/pyruvate phosphate dikinase
MKNSCNVIDLAKAYLEDKDLIGEKAFELAEMKRLNILIPEGFVIKSSFFREFLHETGISKEIKKTKENFHPALRDTLENYFQPIRDKIIDTHVPQHLALEFHKFYKMLAGEFTEAAVNIISSTKTDKSETFSSIKGDANIFLKIKKIYAKYFDNPTAIVIMKNIKAEIKGQIFTNNPIFDRKLQHEQIEKLKNYCKLIQKRFYFPKEIEFTVSKGKIYITKINPFTGSATKSPSIKLISEKRIKKIIKGVAISPGIATGTVKKIYSKIKNIEIKKGDVIILRSVVPSALRNFRNAKAIIIDNILPKQNIAVFKKSFQVPAVSGTKNAEKIFHNGNIVTVNGITGEIYSGGLI